MSADIAEWGRQYPDMKVKLAKAVDALGVEGAWQKGAIDSRFHPSARKVRMPLGNLASRKGYRIVYLPVPPGDEVHVLIGGIYPKPAYPDKVPVRYITRIRNEFAEKIEELIRAHKESDA